MKISQGDISLPVPFASEPADGVNELTDECHPMDEIDPRPLDLSIEDGISLFDTAAVFDAVPAPTLEACDVAPSSSEARAISDDIMPCQDTRYPLDPPANSETYEALHGHSANSIMITNPLSENNDSLSTGLFTDAQIPISILPPSFASESIATPQQPVSLARDASFRASIAPNDWCDSIDRAAISVHLDGPSNLTVEPGTLSVEDDDCGKRESRSPSPSSFYSCVTSHSAMVEADEPHDCIPTTSDSIIITNLLYERAALNSESKEAPSAVVLANHQVEPSCIPSQSSTVAVPAGATREQLASLAQGHSSQQLIVPNDHGIDSSSTSADGVPSLDTPTNLIGPGIPLENDLKSHTSLSSSSSVNSEGMSSEDDLDISEYDAFSPSPSSSDTLATSYPAMTGVDEVAPPSSDSSDRITPLPTEILQRIFLLCVPCDPDDPFRPLRTCDAPFVLRHVCNAWKVKADGYCRLWGTMIHTSDADDDAVTTIFKRRKAYHYDRVRLNLTIPLRKPTIRNQLEIAVSSCHALQVDLPPLRFTHDFPGREQRDERA
ncbi:hypothetical protein DXG03_002229 [Asterophora parasitica]|uniref:F-box domain-containing protein n=1 Tax=Asterophora parasitica TaxID=117018 RepID=A0A9P7K9Y0_9AGAR|nr:hypothetical protein DXG03_002229 [Asterophora parasitica]